MSPVSGLTALKIISNRDQPHKRTENAEHFLSISSAATTEYREKKIIACVRILFLDLFVKIHALSQQYGTDPPRIHFDEESGLRSTEFDDMYFPPHQGLEAAFHVFCRPNQIQERWKKKTHFCISELGFGTGLNFFATALLWRRSGPASGHLSFRSFEKFPLAPAVIREALSPYQEICDIVDGYCTQAPSPLLGLHRLIFSDLRITLDLYYGEALHSLEETQFSADAWYFDGFAPRRNPEMWSEELFAR